MTSPALHGPLLRGLSRHTLSWFFNGSASLLLSALLPAEWTDTPPKLPSDGDKWILLPTLFLCLSHNGPSDSSTRLDFLCSVMDMLTF